MMFDLSPEQQAVRDRAREIARNRVATVAAAIDESASIPDDVMRELQSLNLNAERDATSVVVSVEQIAAASAAAGAASALRPITVRGANDAPGLRGFAAPATVDSRTRLVFAAVALGVGRAALDMALDVLRTTTRGSQEPEKPHWVVADAATELEAARLITLQAAQRIASSSEGEGLVAMAKLAATRAAEQAVNAAVRVAGPDGYLRGALLERLSRDIRSVSLLMGTEEELRAAAARVVLPG